MNDSDDWRIRGQISTPLGHLFERNISLSMGQAPVIHYMPMLFDKIMAVTIYHLIITHKMPLEQASDAYRIFNDHEDECIKVILQT